MSGFKLRPQKSTELEPPEMAALRRMAMRQVVDQSMLQRLEKRGLVELKSGAWTITVQGRICLMFAAAR